jgi:predicted dehydrogenase
MIMKPKIVQIGVGKFGLNHFKTLMKLDEKKIIDFIGIVDKDIDILSKIKKCSNISTSTDVKDFLNVADGFDVVTPPQLHYDMVKKLLNSNKHVFVEKPLSLNFKDSYKLACLSKKNKQTLQVGHIFRYNSTITELKKILERKPNRPTYVKANFLQDRIPRHNNGAIFVYMHGFDILDYLFNLEPKKIFAMANIKKFSPMREINSTINIQYRNINAFLNVGWIPTGVQRRLDFFSDKRHLICDLLTNQISIYENGKLLKKLTVIQKDEPLFLELKDFSKCIKENSTPKVDGFIGSKIVKICELATKSISQNTIVDFN